MRGMGNMKNMQGMMKQIQKMQKEVESAQKTLSESEFVGVANNDLVKVTFTGNKKLTKVEIDPAVIDPDDKEILEDLVQIAVNDALDQIDAETEKSLGKYAKDLPQF